MCVGTDVTSLCVLCMDFYFFLHIGMIVQIVMDATVSGCTVVTTQELISIQNRTIWQVEHVSSLV